MKKKSNCFITMLLALTLALGAILSIQTTVYADETASMSGACGDNVTWVIDDGGVLTISGTGDMDSYYSLQTIPWYGYQYYISSVVVSEGVTSIGASAFYGCDYLTNADIAASVTAIGDGAFADSSLETITGMSGVKTFGDYVFQGTKLTEFVFPEETVSMGDYIFYDCEKLTEITIPASVTSMGDNIAYNALAVTAVHVGEGNVFFCDVDGVLYDLEQTTLIAYPAAKEGSSFTVPDTVTTLAPYCFSYQTQLTTVEIPAAVTVIGDGAFFNMSALEVITIPETVTSVGYFTFEGSSLQTLYFNASVSETPYRMCYECLNLETASFGNEQLVTIFNWAFPFCSDLSSVALPPKLERIEASTFHGCESLTELDFPATITYIDGSAFKNSGITEFPSWLTMTDSGAYMLLGQISVTGSERYDMSYEVLYLVNQERAAEGLEPLVMDEELLNAAMQRAAELTVNFSHTRPDGTSCFSASDKIYGENIAVGQSSAGGAMDSWMNSTGHRANILGSDYTSIGIGCFYHNGIYYWVQCFGANEAADFTAPVTQMASRTMNVQTDFLDEPYLSLYCSDNSIETNKTETLAIYMQNQGWSAAWCRPDASCFDWTSSDTSVATVDSGGVVTVVGSGKYIITATLKTAPYTAFTYTNSYGGYYYGDVDLSGDLTASDALLILQHVVKLKIFTDDTALKLADVNCDGSIAASDALRVLQVVVKLADAERM